jgi:hypothetical protein
MKRILTVVAWAVVACAAAAGAADAQTPQFTLSGLVVVEGGGRAWLQEPVLTQNQPVALRPGESIGPYRLTKIFDDRVELVGPSGSMWVFLAGIQGPTVAAPAPAPQPPPPVPPVTNLDERVIPLQLRPPLAEVPAGTPRVDFESLLRGALPH